MASTTTRNNYRNLCAARMTEYARWTGRATYDGNWPPNESDLMLHDESGVKRLVVARTGDSGIASGLGHIGPGFTSWGDLYTFLDGMCEAERLREYDA